MKIKNILFTTCLGTAALLQLPSIQAQQATPTPVTQPGAAPKFGPENSSPEAGRPKRDPEARLARLKEALALTPDQETKIRELFKTEMQERRANRKANKGDKPTIEERRTDMKANREKTEAAMKSILTPEQQIKFASMKKDWKKRGPGSDIPKP